MKPTPYYRNGKHGITIYCGDSRKLMPRVGPYALLFTSPPYLDRRNYHGCDPWQELVPPVIVQADRTAQVLVNLGIVTVDGRVVRYWNPLIDVMEAADCPLRGWYVWDKLKPLPGSFPGKLKPSHEWIFHFACELRCANRCVPTARPGKLQRRFAGVRNSSGQGNDSNRDNSHVIASHRVMDSVIRRLAVQDAKDHDDFSREHPAVMSYGIASDIISTFTGGGEVVLDPFGGSMTTAIAAARLGRQSIMIELSEEYCRLGIERIKAALAKPIPAAARKPKTENRKPRSPAKAPA